MCVSNSFSSILHSQISYVSKSTASTLSPSLPFWVFGSQASMLNNLPELDSQRTPVVTSLWPHPSPNSTSLGSCQQWWPTPHLKFPPLLASVRLPSEFHCKTKHISLKDTANSQIVFPSPSKIKGSERSYRMGSMCLHMQRHPLHTFAQPSSPLFVLWGKNKDDKAKPKFP